MIRRARRQGLLGFGHGTHRDTGGVGDLQFASHKMVDLPSAELTVRTEAASKQQYAVASSSKQQQQAAVSSSKLQ